MRLLLEKVINQVLNAGVSIETTSRTLGKSVLWFPGFVGHDVKLS